MQVTGPFSRIESDELGCKHCDNTGSVPVRSGEHEYNQDACTECDNYLNETGLQSVAEAMYE